MSKSKKKVQAKNKKTGMIAMIGLIAAAFIAGILLIGNPGDKAKSQTVSNNSAQPSGVSSKSGATGSDIVIDKSKITEKAAFIPYMSGSTKMEVIAVKAPDGTIRTAMNTCQVCYDSGRGYYKQEGDELVCQNCQNRFNISKIEKIKNGCNPVPITSEYKTETDTTITIQAAFLDENKELFADWKR